jgi:hypothetical protein
MWSPPMSCKQDKYVQQLILAWITIIDWEYKKWLHPTDKFNNWSRLWICRDWRRSNIVALPSLPPSWHLWWVLSELRLISRWVLSELYLMSRGVLTWTKWVLSYTRLVLSRPWAILQNYISHKIYNLYNKIYVNILWSTYDTGRLCWLEPSASTWLNSWLCLLPLEELPAKKVSSSHGQTIFLTPLRKPFTVCLAPLPCCFDILFQRISG